MEYLFLIAVIPSIILGWFINKFDKQEKEPKKLLLLLFIGGLLAIPVTLIISFITDFINPIDVENLNVFTAFIYAFIFVAVVEEGSKMLFLRTFTWKSKEFNYLYDGIIYGAFVALGFATFENILYVFSNGFVNGIVRALTAVPGHFFDGVFMGFFYAKSKEAQVLNKKNKLVIYTLLSFIVPVCTHGLYDYLLMANFLPFYFVFIGYVIIQYIVAFALVFSLSKVETDILGYNRNRYFCSECGTRMDKYNYCPECGTKRV